MFELANASSVHTAPAYNNGGSICCLRWLYGHYSSVHVMPQSQKLVCVRSPSALVLRAPQWRVDQKDVPKRKAAAEAGLKEFLQTSNCFKSSELRRLPSMIPTVVAAEVASANGQSTR